MSRRKQRPSASMRDRRLRPRRGNQQSFADQKESRMTQAISAGHDTAARILLEGPRRAIALHILLVPLLGGGLVGLLIAIAIDRFTTFTDDKLWIYAFGISIALLLKILGQWIWLVFLRPLLPKYVRSMLDRIGLQSVKTGRIAPEQSSQLSILVGVVVATAIATILATEDVSPGWVSTFPSNLLTPAIAGAIAGTLESVSASSKLYPLWYNRNFYEEHLGDSKKR